jgi:uncharacterized protein (TIGR02246 family)
MRLSLVGLTLLISAVPIGARAQIIPGGNRDGGGYGQYMSGVRAHVDTLRMQWEAAVAARDAKKVAALYDSDALFVTTTGARMKGRGSVRDAYERLLPRMRSARLSIQSIVASGDMAFVSGDVTYDVPLPTGGTYPHTSPISLAVKALWTGAYAIHAQSGGDIAAIAKLGDLPAGVAAATTDTLRVRVTDISGAGVPGVLVAFETLNGHGTLAPTAALTDANGVARVAFTAGPDAEQNVVRAQAAPLTDEPVFFSVPTLASDASASKGSKVGAAPVSPTP